MIDIPFFKLHGARTIFCSPGPTWPVSGTCRKPRGESARATLAWARDGWMLLWSEPDGLRTRLFNSDGSEPEISGNGTRCAAAFALWSGVVAGPQVAITTAAGRKLLTLKDRRSTKFVFEMDMGLPRTGGELRCRNPLAPGRLMPPF